MIRINLLPTRQSKKKEMGRQQLALMACLVLVALGGNWIWYSRTSSALEDKKQAVAKLQSDIKQLDTIIGEITNIKKDQEALKQKLEILDKLRKGRSGPVKMLDALASLMPERVWLKNLDGSGGSLVIRGGAVTNEDLADFMRELKKSPNFQEPALKKAVQVDDKALGARFIDFELTCGVNDV